MMSLYKLLWPDGPTAAVVVGGGGKTSLMAGVSREAAEQKLPLILSTTTRLQKPCPLPAVSIFIGSRKPIPSDHGKYPSTGPLLWVGGETAGGSKWIGPDLPILETLLENEYGKPARRAVLIEADGSAGRPLKAPGPGEPVIPRFIDTFAVVVGLSALGRPVSEETVHRLDPFLRITGSSPGERITTDLILRLITHPSGSFKSCPAGLRRLLILNQADTPEIVRLAEKIAESVMSRTESGITLTTAVTSLRNENRIWSNISI